MRLLYIVLLNYMTMFSNVLFFKKKNFHENMTNSQEITIHTERKEDKYKGHLYERLQEDYRIKEGLKACMNCGVCTAVCPAAEFYRYNPKNIVNIVQRKDEDELEQLLKSDTIWYCGECMSCVADCFEETVDVESAFFVCYAIDDNCAL